MLKITSRK